MTSTALVGAETRRPTLLGAEGQVQLRRTLPARIVTPEGDQNRKPRQADPPPALKTTLTNPHELRVLRSKLRTGENDRARQESTRLSAERTGRWKRRTPSCWSPDRRERAGFGEASLLERPNLNTDQREDRQPASRKGNQELPLPSGQAHSAEAMLWERQADLKDRNCTAEG